MKLEKSPNYDCCNETLNPVVINHTLVKSPIDQSHHNDTNHFPVKIKEGIFQTSIGEVNNPPSKKDIVPKKTSALSFIGSFFAGLFSKSAKKEVDPRIKTKKTNSSDNKPASVFSNSINLDPILKTGVLTDEDLTVGEILARIEKIGSEMDQTIKDVNEALKARYKKPLR